MDKFNLQSPFSPQADQSSAIEKICNWINKGEKFSTLLGATGTGKTFTVANIINQIQKPTLIISHNKTLAAQLAQEFQSFFPNNAVHYFVSYYDYYQPESYLPTSDTYIAKESQINEEIDRLRFEATTSLLTRKDVIIIASVSCIYGLGEPKELLSQFISITKGEDLSIKEVATKLVSIQYERNDIDLTRGHFRISGDVLEIFPANSKENLVKIEFFGNEVEKISVVTKLTRKTLETLNEILIPPATHHVTERSKMDPIIAQIEKDLEIQLDYFNKNNKPLEAERIEQRVRYDIEMMKETGFCTGIENYSRYIDGRAPGTSPYTLIDYFGDDFLMVMDESHITLPQIRAMYNGDYARKKNLIDFGFRLPAAFDNRPLKKEEFDKKIPQMVFMSATPGPEEYQVSKKNIAEQIIRPTGLLDPIIETRPTNTQVEDIAKEIAKTTLKNERTLVTTLTKKTAEDLADYLLDLGVKTTYLHSEIKTMERLDIIKKLRQGKYDCLIGVNLLREGLDLPEVSLIGIIDADKEGFLRSKTSLIQTIGRAARHQNGKVIMYADKITDSMDYAIKETNRRRKIQEDYNTKNNITPTTIIKEIKDDLMSYGEFEDPTKDSGGIDMKKMNKADIQYMIKQLELEMEEYAASLAFEKAAELRDKIEALEEQLQKKSKK